MKIILGMVIGFLAPFTLGYIYIISGAIPVSTKSQPLPLEKFISRKALHAAIKGEVDRPAPFLVNEENLLRGAKVYNNQCAVCHGLPDKAKTPIAQGLFPPPPQLFKGHGVTDDLVGETYWKVKNGIRLTGMPGFEGALTDEEMWSVSLLLLHANELSENIQKALKTF